jgi:glycosyltransferase involved in cell wall biosynthesis
MDLVLVIEEVNCGGAELSFFALCRALAGRASVHLAISDESLRNPTMRALHDSLADTGTIVHRCRAPLNPGTLSNLHPALRRSAAQELADLIHTIRPALVLVNLPTVERGQAVADAAELCRPRPPVWGFLHLSQPPSTIGAKLGWVRDLMVPTLLRRFDRLFTVSEDGAQEVSQRYRVGRPQVLRPPTASLAPVASADKSKLRRSLGLPDTFLLGIVGRLDLHHKRQDVALRVTQQLLLRGKTLTLVILGDGRDRSALERMTDELEIRSSVTFLGWRDDIDKVLPLLDAVVIPSKYEGFPLTAVQAATAHVPVVGYAVGGLPELVPGNFMVPPGDENGLVTAVAGLLQGTPGWPAREVAQRAAQWCDPDTAAGQIVKLARAELEPGH